ncbi:MAG: SRPBCC domain-containing protein [Candidatus Dormibacteraeota bacterium]|nr:SRPBCC domain-containing protein [Candidatus Dormibacteraeota bacterium]
MGDLVSQELRFTRIFEAPRVLVFRCMIEPQHLTHFWGPRGVSAPLDEIHVDPRPGGRFDVTMVNDADGSRYQTRAVYVEVSEPERLVWDEMHSGMRVSVTFLELDAQRTEVRIVQQRVPEPMRSPEAQAGFMTSLDKFSEYLRRMP